MAKQPCLFRTLSLMWRQQNEQSQVKPLPDVRGFDLRDRLQQPGVPPTGEEAPPLPPPPPADKEQFGNSRLLLTTGYTSSASSAFI